MKSTKLKICDWSLLALTVLTLASSIQLEATGSSGVAWIWLHIFIAILFFSDIVWHVYLHFAWKAWFNRFRKLKSSVTRWLAIFGLLTLLSGLAAVIHWFITMQHSPLGAVHGKIGFVFLALAIAHTAKRIRFFNH